MSLSILVDMNLSVEWVSLLTDAGWPSVHWSNVGDPRAEDSVIMAWARAHGHVLFTHDLDFGTALALTHAEGPSVIQARGQAILPEQLAATVTAALRHYEAELLQGALVVEDAVRARVRILPL